MALSGRVDLRMVLFEELEAAVEEGGLELREGHEFRDQRQVPARAQQAIAVTPAAGANVVRLVRQVVRELRAMEMTGQAPGGRDWCGQPWWRVALWESFWQGQAQAGGDAECWGMAAG